MRTDIYQRRGRFKIGLVIGALLILGGSQYYTSHLARQIARDERTKVELWAAAIAQRAELVRVTSDLFERIGEDQRKSVEIWGEATRLVPTVDDVEVVSFLARILSENTNIPVLLTDQDRTIIAARNVPFEDGPYPTDGQAVIDSLFGAYPPIEIDFESGRNYIYYSDSRIFTDLKAVLNDLVNSFMAEVVLNSASLPVVLVSEDGRAIASNGIDSTDLRPDVLSETLASMAAENPPISVELGDGRARSIYYRNSRTYKQLTWFPLVQFTVIGGFLMVGYVLFSISRNAQQNRVWVGLAKETAHQLGTPISSLSGWVDHIRDGGADLDADLVATEIEKDIDRLELITDRFSKIGASPEMTVEDVDDILRAVVGYFRARSSRRLIIDLEIEDTPLTARVNASLFGWVIENLLKNAIDAMEGRGRIRIHARRLDGCLVVDVEDSGKGIPKNRFKTVFEPGYSTKKRGWGLGLSLSRRIIRDYHKGRIHVLRSSADGTTFRIQLPPERVD